VIGIPTAGWAAIPTGHAHCLIVCGTRAADVEGVAAAILGAKGGRGAGHMVAERILELQLRSAFSAVTRRSSGHVRNSVSDPGAMKGKHGLAAQAR